MYINYNLFLKSKKCPKLFYLEAQKNKHIKKAKELVHYAHEYVKPYQKVVAQSNEEAFEKTKQLLKDCDDPIVDGVFIFNNCYVKVDALKQTTQGLVLYIAKGSTRLSRDYRLEAAFVYYVVSSCGYNIASLYIMTINQQYIRYGHVDARLLFINHDVTMDCYDDFEKTHKQVKLLNDILLKNEPDIDISTSCLMDFGCPYQKYCFHDLPDYNIFQLSGLEKKKMIEYYDHDIISYQDIYDNKIPLTEKQVQQVESYVLQKEPYINKRRVNYFINQLTYPLYFLDFETFQIPVPLYQGCHPYQQIPFQYSLHSIEYPGAPVKHHAFLGNGVDDPRYELAKALCHDIPNGSCILAYNNHLEKTVVMSLAILFEEFRDQLLSIYTNIFDLQDIFANGDYYHRDMHGSHSLKSVLPALVPELDYHNLDHVHNGTEAMMTYTHLHLLNEEQRETARAQLLEYCHLDTYAMVKILEKIKTDLNRP